MQNVVRKPGCETFEIDFGNSDGGVIGKKPELSKKTFPSKIVPRKIALDRLPNSARITSRRPLKKVEKDERNQAIRRISADNYRNYTRPHSVGRCVDRRNRFTKSSHAPGSCGYCVLLLKGIEIFFNVKYLTRRKLQCAVFLLNIRDFEYKLV